MGGGKAAATELCEEQLPKEGLSATAQPGARLPAPRYVPVPGLPPAEPVLGTQSWQGDLRTKGGLVK